MTLATGDFTSLATAKAYVEPTPSDALLTGLISRVSQEIRDYLNRPFLLPRSYTERYNGQGTNALVLYNFPLIGDALTSLIVGGVTIGVAPQPNNANFVNSSPPLNAPFGYRVVPGDSIPPGNNPVIELVGGSFYRGNQNIIVTYRAGYEVVDEAATVPAASGPYTVTPQTPYGAWASDGGVTLADGTALTATTSSTPADGEYQPPNPDLASPRLNYTFNAAQASAAVLLSYGYVPGALEQVALEVIAERASYRRRVGILSQSLAAQESVAFAPIAGGNTSRGYNAFAYSALQAYVNVLGPPMGANT